MQAEMLREPTETLLVVDDDPLMTDVFRQFMSRRGYQVLTAVSGREALAMFDASVNPIALVITDMTMPDMDGMALALALAQRSPRTPVLIATGHDLDRTEPGFPTNVVEVVRKPYQNRYLAERIRTVLDSRSDLSI